MHILEEVNLSNTPIVFLHRTKIRSQIIYTVTLFAVTICFAALPFIYTTVSVKSSGSLQSSIEKMELLAPATGRIIHLNLKDNQKVEMGKILMNIDATSPVQQTFLLKNRIVQLEQLLQDASVLFKLPEYSSIQPVLQTGLYLASWQQYSEQIHHELNARDQALQIYKRYETLYNKKVVTQSEYEQYKFNYEQACSSLSIVSRKYGTQWQTEANQYRNELRDLQNQDIQLTEQKKSYTLKAPISGSLQNLTGLQVGSFVSMSQKLGEISPDTSLLAFCYIKPADIGLIKKGQKVTFQIDAFNYNQWGLLTGSVKDISDDIVIINQAPYFKVKCQLDRDYLKLKNGYKGQVKKGMTFSARFIVTSRSLYHLLYDKMDDWLNPDVQTHKEA